MSYIDLLTKEEKSILCEIVTGKEFKELFKRNEQGFSKIQKGFRAKSLTEQHALSIAINNIDKSFIANWVNMRVEDWLKQIEENIAELEKEGFSHSAALAMAMLDSFFVDHVELYFKLIGTPVDADTCSHLYERMEDVKFERERNAKILNKIKDMEEENQRLSNQVEEAQQTITDTKIECREQVQKIEERKDQLEVLLTEAQAKISELQTAPSAFASDDTEYLAEFDDTDNSILPSHNTDEIVSLCGVISDYSDQKWLIRHADLSSNGQYDIFHRNEDILPYFTNRDKIFHKDGPSREGFYGIWTWSAVPNENDPSKDYILSRYNTKIDAIELVPVTQAASLDELVNHLREGINYQPHSRKIMFSIDTSNGQHTGILCNIKDLNTVNEKTNISEDCIAVPVYEFTGDDVIHLNNGLSFYRNAFAGIPNKLYHLKSPLDIVKDNVLSSISWSTYKTREVTRTQYRSFRDFMKAIPVDDITCKIGAACRCAAPAAKELLDEFLKVVWKYVDGDSLEDEIVRSAISANTELQEKAKELIRQDWEKENGRLLTEAQQKLDLFHDKLESATEKLGQAQESFGQTKAEEERLSSLIAEKEKLANDIEKAVAERIQKARENVADFVASMAFVSGQPVQAVETETHSLAGAPFELDAATYCVCPEFENLDDLESYRSWEDVINTAEFEFAEAGVAKQYRSGLAAFLCAAYLEKQPLLLVGPNAIDIAQAFSAVISAHKHGVLYCEGNFDRQAIKKVGADGEDIVIVNNLLTSGWMNRLPEMLSQKDIFYIATHPYAEDVQVEPKSLYGFMLPLFTEVLVDKKATGKYYGGYFSDDFEPYSSKKGMHKELTALSKLPLSSLVKGKINSLVAIMHNIYPSATADDEFLFFVFPIAYASMAIDELAEAVADSQKGITISANLKRDLKYVLGENG